MSHPPSRCHPIRDYQLKVHVDMTRGGTLILMAAGNNKGEVGLYWMPKKEGGKLYPVKDELVVSKSADEAYEEYFVYVGQQEWEANEAAWEDHCESQGDRMREEAMA